MAKTGRPLLSGGDVYVVEAANKVLTKTDKVQLNREHVKALLAVRRRLHLAGLKIGEEIYMIDHRLESRRLTKSAAEYLSERTGSEV